MEKLNLDNDDSGLAEVIKMDLPSEIWWPEQPSVPTEPPQKDEKEAA